jgi:hypothetical protein
LVRRGVDVIMAAAGTCREGSDLDHSHCGSARVRPGRTWACCEP